MTCILVEHTFICDGPYSSKGILNLCRFNINFHIMFHFCITLSLFPFSNGGCSEYKNARNKPQETIIKIICEGQVEPSNPNPNYMYLYKISLVFEFLSLQLCPRWTSPKAYLKIRFCKNVRLLVTNIENEKNVENLEILGKYQFNLYSQCSGMVHLALP